MNLSLLRKSFLPIHANGQEPSFVKTWISVPLCGTDLRPAEVIPALDAGRE
jgi:hypothetical protein